MKRCSLGPHGQAWEENNPGIGLDDDIISNLGAIHKACKPATYMNTEKAAILKRKLVKNCQVPYANLSSHQPYLTKRHEYFKKFHLNKVWSHLIATFYNLLHVIAIIINPISIWALIRLLAKLLKGYTQPVQWKTVLCRMEYISWCEYSRFMGLNVTVKPVSPYVAFK